MGEGPGADTDEGLVAEHPGEEEGGVAARRRQLIGTAPALSARKASVTTSSPPADAVASLCPMLWEGLDVSRHAIVRPCCAFVGGLPIAGNDVTTAMRSDSWASWRAAALRGATVGGCRRCERKELLGGKSDRQIYRKAAELFHGRPVAQQFVDASAGIAPRRWSLHLGNLCNLRCRMCNANASSQIAADPVQRRWADRESPFDPSALTAKGMHPWATDLAALDRLFGEDVVPTSVQFSGGEPLLFPAVPLLLDRWIDRQVADQIEVSFATNGTRLTGAMLARLGQFKRVSMAISVDGVGATNDYLRHPSRWERIVRNVERIRGIDVLNPWIAFTLSAANLFEAADVAGWAASLGLNFRFGVVEAPRYLALEVLPAKVRAAAAALARNAAGGPLMGRPAASELTAIAAILDEPADGFSPARLAEFMAFMAELDIDRHEHADRVLPRLTRSLAAAGWVWPAATAEQQAGND